MASAIAKVSPASDSGSGSCAFSSDRAATFVALYAGIVTGPTSNTREPRRMIRCGLPLRLSHSSPPSATVNENELPVMSPRWTWTARSRECEDSARSIS